ATREERPFIGAHLEVAIGPALERSHLAARDAPAVALHLRRQPLQQLGARHAIGESGIVVRTRNQDRPASAAIENLDAQAIAQQIDSCRETGRPTPDDDAVQAFFHGSLLGDARSNVRRFAQVSASPEESGDRAFTPLWKYSRS